MHHRKSLFESLCFTLFLAGCAVPGSDSESIQADELATIPKQPSQAVCTGGRWNCGARIRTDDNARVMAFAVPSGLTPNDLASAYALDAQRQSAAAIAIVVAFHYPDAASDLATYRAQFGLPPCSVASGCLTIVNDHGATSPLPGTSNADWNVEAALAS
jgi:hypothetical protein